MNAETSLCLHDEMEHRTAQITALWGEVSKLVDRSADLNRELVRLRHRAVDLKTAFDLVQSKKRGIRAAAESKKEEPAGPPVEPA